MNGPGDIPATNGTASERPCGLTALIPTFGMSCRGRAEAFARRLQSRLRTLGTQSEDLPTNEEDTVLGSTDNTWLTQDGHHEITNRQPLRHGSSNEADSYFDFDCEPESPGSPADECEYSRLIETASVTPQHDCAPESGYICASPITPENGSQGSQSSSDGPYFDPETSETEPRSLPTDYFDCIEAKRELNTKVLVNGHCEAEPVDNQNDSSDSLSESLPPSQESTSTNATSANCSSLTFTGASSASNSTLQDVVLAELQQQSNDYNKLHNGHFEEGENLHEEHEQKNNEVESQKQNQEESLPVQNLEENHKENNENHENCEELKTQEEKNSEEVKPLTNGFVEIVCSEDSCSISIQNMEVNNIQITSNNQNESQEQQEETNNENGGIETDKKHLSACDTDDDEDCRPQRVRRCSSLKTGKTPPGTPGRKKIVRFADVLGLDLADVKTFLDEIPTIPKSAYEDLDVADSIDPPIQLGPRIDKILMPLFQQPAALPNFLDIVREKQLSLENAAVTDSINLTITGSVRVRNLDFHKSVHIRYSLDNWRSFADLQANYVQNSCDGFSDKFSFVLFGNSMSIGQRLEFAVRFQCKGQQFWDSNYGANYCFQCLPATTPVNVRPIIPHHHASAIISPPDLWCGGSFY